MSYQDQGNKKWFPFLMPEQKGLLKHRYQEVNHFKFDSTLPIDATIENSPNDTIFSRNIISVTAINGPSTEEKRLVDRP